MQLCLNTKLSILTEIDGKCTTLYLSIYLRVIATVALIIYIRGYKESAEYTKVINNK